MRAGLLAGMTVRADAHQRLKIEPDCVVMV
jgi:hypothetical protein